MVSAHLPEGPDWTYELKFDGFRALVIKDEQRVELRSRKNKDPTEMYRGIAAAGLRLKAAAARIEDKADAALPGIKNSLIQALHNGQQEQKRCR